MALLLGSGAWLVHAVSQLKHVVPLMAATVIHQFGAAVWVGGLLHLTVLRRVLRNSPQEESLWPTVVARFSLLAMLSLGTMLAAALYLSVSYIGDWGGLISTAYGAMVLTKTALLVVALSLGALNFLNVRRWTHTGDASGLSERAPVLIEAEVFIVMIILSAAAALTSQPPAVDQVADRPSPREILKVFSPKLPQLVPPPPQEISARATSSFEFLTSP
ncbi:MAG TPA: CopD family protein, partial [Candidatus Acidoferrum sp.]|nr:CopD family protein [Candidatus Acidoferrum sp.]